MQYIRSCLICSLILYCVSIMVIWLQLLHTQKKKNLWVKIFKVPQTCFCNNRLSHNIIKRTKPYQAYGIYVHQCSGWSLYREQSKQAHSCACCCCCIAEQTVYSTHDHVIQTQNHTTTTSLSRSLARSLNKSSDDTSEWVRTAKLE